MGIIQFHKGLEQMYGEEKAEKILNDWNDFVVDHKFCFGAKII